MADGGTCELHNLVNEYNRAEMTDVKARLKDVETDVAVLKVDTTKNVASIDSIGEKLTEVKDEIRSMVGELKTLCASIVELNLANATARKEPEKVGLWGWIKTVNPIALLITATICLVVLVAFGVTVEQASQIVNAIK